MLASAWQLPCHLHPSSSSGSRHACCGLDRSCHLTAATNIVTVYTTTRNLDHPRQYSNLRLVRLHTWFQPQPYRWPVWSAAMLCRHPPATMVMLYPRSSSMAFGSG